MQKLKHQARGTYGHHGTSIGRSRARSPQTVSALQMEGEELRRKKLKESRLRASHRPGDKRRHMEKTKKREQTAPKHKKAEHKHPGPAPKRRQVRNDPELEAKLQGAGAGDKAEWERRQAATRAQYASMPAKPPSPGSDARFEARRAEYSLDKYAQPSAEDLAAHRQKEAAHHQEQQATAKQQELFEKHGKRKIDPAGFKAPERVAPAQMPSAKIGGAKGHEAQMAQIMRPGNW